MRQIIQLPVSRERSLVWNFRKDEISSVFFEDFGRIRISRNTAMILYALRLTVNVDERGRGLSAPLRSEDARIIALILIGDVGNVELRRQDFLSSADRVAELSHFVL